MNDTVMNDTVMNDTVMNDNHINDIINDGSEIRTDVIVVGGGLAGLTAARLAAAAGARAIVVEPHTIGGRGRTDDRHGFLLNRGPHALYLGGAARRVLEQLRAPIDGGPP